MAGPLGGIQGMLQGGLQGAISDVTGRREAGQSFSKVLTENQLVTDGKNLTAGDFTKTGEFVVPAQEEYSWGQGAAKFAANQGYIYVELRDNAVAPGNLIDGDLRVQQRDAQERNIVTVMEERTNVLRGSQTDREQQKPLPEQTDYPKVGRDSILAMALNPDSTATIGKANSTILAPVTVYPV